MHFPYIYFLNSALMKLKSLTLKKAKVCAKTAVSKKKKNFPSAIIPVWNHVFATSPIEMKIIIKIIIYLF